MKNIYKRAFSAFKEKTEALRNVVKNRLKLRSRAEILSASLVIVMAFTIPVLASSVLPQDESALTASIAAKSAGSAGETAAESFDAFGIFADGELIALLPDESMAGETLDALLESFTDAGAESAETSFKENVTAEQAEADGSVPYFESAEEAKQYILDGSKDPLTYTVGEKDTLWDIAKAAGISYYELQAMNPDMDPKKLHVGDTVYLYERRPFVTVVTKERIREIEELPFDTVYEYTDTMYSGQYAVKTAGVKGSAETLREYVKENGAEISNEIIEQSVISEPVAQESYAGTATIQIQRGSGQLQAPVDFIKINSPFGASRVGHTHAGVDLGASKGDPIYAADDGTVVMSKYSGTYGNVIKIDHGNGIVTVYAHCSELLVSYGDDVAKGQLIGRIGMTGNATGYLLHFEVQVNGKAQNPMNYL